MLIAYVSCDFGFGVEFTKDQLDKINKHTENECYLNKEAAIKLNNNTVKLNLTSGFFRTEIDYSILQLEDIEGKFDYIFPLTTVVVVGNWDKMDWM